jgi:hypothetical protein
MSSLLLVASYLFNYICNCMTKFSRVISRVKWLSGETLVFSPLNHFTRLIVRENFIILSRRESNKSHICNFLTFSLLTGSFSLHHRIQTGCGGVDRIPWVPGALFRGVKWPGRETYHSPPCSAEVENARRCSSTLQYAFVTRCSVKAQGQLCIIKENQVSKVIRNKWIKQKC